MVVAVRRRDGRPRFAGVCRMMEGELGHPDVVLVPRVDENLVEIEWPRAQLLRVVLERPVHAAVVRAVQTALRAFRLHLRIHHLGIRLRDVDPDLANQIVGQAVAHMRPVIAAVRRFVDAAFARRAAADNRPRLALRAPRARIDLVGVRPIDRNRDGAGLLVDEEHLFPGLAAVLRSKDAALRAPAERIALRRRVNDVGILRIDLDLADLADVFEAGELPGLSRVGRLVDAAPEDHVRTDRFAAGSHVDDVRIRVGDVDGADRAGRDLAVGHREPRDAVVLRLPHTAAARAQIEDAWLRADARGRRRAAAAMRTNRSPAQVLIRFQIDGGVCVGLRERSHPGAWLAERKQAERQDGERKMFFHGKNPRNWKKRLPGL